MGQKNYRDALKEAYFHGADALLGVADVTRIDTLYELEEWIDAMEGVVRPDAPIVFLGNKWDLKDQAQFGREEMENIAEKYDGESYLTSAKTGEHVEEAFTTLAEKVVERRI
jgi:GTPase SAR1 family protein